MGVAMNDTLSELGIIKSDLFFKAVKLTMEFEGHHRLSNIKDDKGGKTKFGISQRAYPYLDIENLKYQDAVQIYYDDYWKKLDCDAIKDKNLAINLFDAAINMGRKNAVKILQKALFMDKNQIDGFLGPITNKAIKLYYEKHETIVGQFIMFRILKYYEIIEKDSSQKIFFRGWVIRTMSLHLI